VLEQARVAMVEAWQRASEGEQAAYDEAMRMLLEVRGVFTLPPDVSHVLYVCIALGSAARACRREAAHASCSTPSTRVTSLRCRPTRQVEFLPARTQHKLELFLRTALESRQRPIDASTEGGAATLAGMVVKACGARLFD
jgi:hypothetical protein